MKEDPKITPVQNIWWTEAKRENDNNNNEDLYRVKQRLLLLLLLLSLFASVHHIFWTSVICGVLFLSHLLGGSRNFKGIYAGYVLFPVGLSSVAGLVVYS